MLLPLLLFLCIHLLIIGSAALFIYLKKYPYLPPTGTLTKVSILIAARNEEANLPRCLDAIATLDYPFDKIEILVGDDQSEDATASIVEDYALKYPHFRLISIKPGKTRGKANVLAQLAREAKGDYFLITDADIALPPQWIKGLLQYAANGYSMVSGTTITVGKGFWGSLEQLDWLNLMAIYQFTDSLMGITAMGNNMLISSEAYSRTGGYENLPFSITEDYILYKTVRNQGGRHIHIMNAQTIGISQPTGSLKTYLHQRRRWALGAGNKPLPYWLPMPFYILYLPALVWLFFLSWKLALGVALTRMLLQWFLLLSAKKRLSIKLNHLQVIYFEPYLHIGNLLIMLYSLWPAGIYWKGRRY